MKNWFLSLAPRERVMVTAAAVVAVAALFYVAIWQPLDQGAEDIADRIERERDLAAHIATLGAEAAKLRDASQGNVRSADTSLLSVIDRSSRKAELGDAVQRIQPQGSDKAVVTIEGAGFNAVVVWLHELQQTYGVSVSALNVTRAEDDGLIEARMTLERTTG